jgi:hypothetical protein
VASLNHERIKRIHAESGRTGQRYPTDLMLSKHLDERGTPAHAEPTRVVSIQK